MRRALAAVAFLLAAAVLAPVPPAHALQRYCDDDEWGDVNRVENHQIVEWDLDRPKANLVRYCATLSLRLTLRWRMPHVDPRTEEFWGDSRAWVWAVVDPDNDDTRDYIVIVRGPFTNERFEVGLYYATKAEPTRWLFQECDHMVGAYDPVYKAIRAGLPSYCIGSPSSVKTIGVTHRDPTPATGGSYLYDQSAELSVALS